MRNPAIGKAFRWLKRNLFGGEVRIIPKLILYFILIVFSLIYIEPVLYIISTSFKNYADLVDPTAKWIPKEGTLVNFMYALEELKVIPQFTRDKTFWETISSSPMFLSVMTSVPAAVIQTVTCALAGYGLAKLKVPCKKALIVLLVFSS